MSQPILQYEVSPISFCQRFPCISSLNDPFSRQFVLTYDSVTSKQCIYKHYLCQTQQQQQAIMDNLQNYRKLGFQQGICRFVGYTKLVQEREILAAFQFDQYTLRQFINLKKKQYHQQAKVRQFDQFYVAFATQILQIIRSMTDMGIDIDQLHYNNILIYYLVQNSQKTLHIKILYDQRQKSFDQVIHQNAVTFSSAKKLQAMIKNDQQYFNQADDLMISQNIYQVGLILLDMMYQCETIQHNNLGQPDDFITRDRPLSRSSSYIPQNQTALNYYTFQDGQVKRRQQFLINKVQHLQNNVQSQVVKEITKIALRMIDITQNRLSLDQFAGQIDRIAKIHKDSQRKTTRNVSIQNNSNNAVHHQNHQENSYQLHEHAVSTTSVQNYSQKQIQTQIKESCKAQHVQVLSSQRLKSQKQMKPSNQSIGSQTQYINQNYVSTLRSKQHLIHSYESIPMISPVNSPQKVYGNAQTTLQSTKQSVEQMRPIQPISYIPSSTYYMPPSSSPSIPHISIPSQTILSCISTCHQSIKNELRKLISDLEHSQKFIRKQYFDNSVYYGEVRENKRTGKGVYVYHQGDTYFGQWHNNQLIKGIYVFKNGQSYQGQVNNGKTGYGNYRYANGNVYQGQWKNDLKQGNGIMYYPNQDSYEGQWLKGKKNGYGTYYYNNGTIYQGNFVNGRKNGMGTITFPNGTKIEANWQQTHIQGPGKVSYPNGDTFTGQYQMSQKTGPGLYIWGSDKSSYEGDFKKDLLQGQAKIHFSQQQSYFGRLKNGKRDGQGVYRYSNGDSFSGEWKNDQKLVGLYKFQNKDQFQGKFKDNQLYFGVLKYSNGQSYQGEFRNGYRHGVGSYRNNNQQVVCEGHWEMDNFVGNTY